MSSFEFPKYTSNQKQGKKGESFFDQFVHSQLEWIYRSVPQESDFGIDGYIDIVTNEAVTGQTIAVQIKCGNSYYDKKTQGGIRYDGENKHLNYYSNCRFPVILVVLNNDCTKGKWVEYDLEKTSASKNGWWTEIPSQNNLHSLDKISWELIAGPVEDFSEQIKQNWKMDKAIDESDFGIYHLPKNEISECVFSGIQWVLKRLTRNKEQLIKNRGTLEILIDGYNDDPREIFEIPEVRSWYRKSIEAGLPWFYFLNAESARGLLSSLYCYCDVEIIDEENGFAYVEFTNPKQIGDWFEKNCLNLNQFTIHNQIPKEINREMWQKADLLLRSVRAEF